LKRYWGYRRLCLRAKDDVSLDAPSASPSHFTGRENDGTGLYYYRARYYDPTRSRFVGEDPMGLAAGINKYAYVKNGPVNHRDPRGLQEIYVYDNFLTDPPGGIPIGPSGRRAITEEQLREQDEARRRVLDDVAELTWWWLTKQPKRLLETPELPPSPPIPNPCPPGT